MRITHKAVVQTSLQGLNRNMDAIQRLQQQLTSGKTINKPSDDPAGTNAAILTRQELATATQHARNISDGMGFLDATDSTLQNMIWQVQKVRDLTVKGLNTGAMGEDSRAAIATEVAGIRESLLGLANRTVQNRPIFGGITAGPAAYDVASGGYVGSGDGGTPINRQVSDADVIRIDITGPEVFGVNDPGATPPTRDLFAIVGDIAGDVVADPAALEGHLAALDEALSRMLKGAADIGTRTSRLETAKQVNADLQLSLTSRSADIENVDLAKTIMNLQMQQTGYEAALGATAKAIQPSLLDFLR
ncbi:flagellar hook-associated protein FlgL [Modestobacter roseus]|uniref:Flagellar hook-associated protein 3 FlgL n=1 Tax=Modestobacter roseus TaxID=1181884 RepID=A0A562IKT4_9ACTN|nr:flagellar hook-associated protein FlgL [Modestobacter roseus]MQA34562.1 flagellar hook-associated protein 3 [Modestobacter roseus]TWH71619.1 flagellar hook-associated protein 3 FlgL [Modestobacter roseus]